MGAIYTTYITHNKVRDKCAICIIEFTGCGDEYYKIDSECICCKKDVIICFDCYTKKIPFSDLSEWVDMSLNDPLRFIGYNKNTNTIFYALYNDNDNKYDNIIYYEIAYKSMRYFNNIGLFIGESETFCCDYCLKNNISYVKPSEWGLEFMFDNAMDEYEKQPQKYYVHKVFLDYGKFLETI